MANDTTLAVIPTQVCGRSEHSHNRSVAIADCSLFIVIPTLLSQSNTRAGSADPYRAIIPGPLLGNVLPCPGSRPRFVKQLLGSGDLMTLLQASMPESYTGEHVYRTHILLNGSSPEVVRESLNSLIFFLSNNQVSLEDKDRWHTILKLFQTGGLLRLDAQLSELLNLHDPTVCSFMEKLFSAAVFWVSCSPDGSVEKGIMGISSTGSSPAGVTPIPG